MESKYYKCTRDLWSIYVIPTYKKFTKDNVYCAIRKDIYINDRNLEDDISVEKWQAYFIPLDPEDVSLSELDEILTKPLETFSYC